MPFIANRYSREKMESGVWLKYEGSEFLIRSANSHFYLAALDDEQSDADRGTGKLARGMKLSAFEYDSQISAHRLMMAAARGLLADWEGVKDADGDDVEPSLENRYRALIDNPAFRVWLTAQANIMDNFQSDEYLEKHGEAA